MRAQPLLVPVRCQWLGRAPSTPAPRSEHTPRSIKPQAGKPFEHRCQSASAKHRGIFGEDPRRPNLANDSQHLKPKPRAIACQARASPCAADVLTREASTDNIDAAGPGSPVEGADVVPDGEGVEASVELTLAQHALAVWVDLDGADCVPAEETRRQ